MVAKAAQTVTYLLLKIPAKPVGVVSIKVTRCIGASPLTSLSVRLSVVAHNSPALDDVRFRNVESAAGLDVLGVLGGLVNFLFHVGVVVG